MLWLVLRHGMFLSLLGVVLGFGGASVVAQLPAVPLPEAPPRADFSPSVRSNAAECICLTTANAALVCGDECEMAAA